MHSNPVQKPRARRQIIHKKRGPTLCPLNNHFHLAELLREVLLGLLSTLAVPSHEWARASDLGCIGGFLESQQELFGRADNIGRLP